MTHILHAPQVLFWTKTENSLQKYNIRKALSTFLAFILFFMPVQRLTESIICKRLHEFIAYFIMM